MEEPEERPKWSVTWLFRVQRVGRNRRPEGETPGRVTFTRVFPWVVTLLLMIFIAVGVWLDLLPR